MIALILMFALAQSADAGKQVALEGEAAVSVLDAAGRATRSAHLQVRDSVLVTADSITATPARAELFVRSPHSPAAASLDLAPGYPEAVTASRPWGYWRFEALTDGAVRNEVHGGPPLRALGRYTVERDR